MEKLLRKAKFAPLGLEEYDLYTDYADKSTGPISPCMSFEMLYMWRDATPAYYREVGKFLLLVVHDRTRGRLYCCPPIGDYKHYSAARALESLMLLFESARLPLRMYYIKDWALPFLRAVQGFTLNEDYDINNSDILYSARDFSYSLRRAENVRLMEQARQLEHPQALDFEEDRRAELLAFVDRECCGGRACALCGGLCVRRALENAMTLNEQLGMPLRCTYGASGMLGAAAYSTGADTLSLLFYQTAGGVPGADQLTRAMITEDMTDRIRYVASAADFNRESHLEYKRALSHYTQSKNYEAEICRSAVAASGERAEGRDDGPDDG